MTATNAVFVTVLRKKTNGSHSLLVMRLFADAADRLEATDKHATDADKRIAELEATFARIDTLLTPLGLPPHPSMSMIERVTYRAEEAVASAKINSATIAELRKRCCVRDGDVCADSGGILDVQCSRHGVIA